MRKRGLVVVVVARCHDRTQNTRGRPRLETKTRVPPSPSTDGRGRVVHGERAGNRSWYVRETFSRRPFFSYPSFWVSRKCLFLYFLISHYSITTVPAVLTLTFIFFLPLSSSTSKKLLPEEACPRFSPRHPPADPLLTYRCPWDPPDWRRFPQRPAGVYLFRDLPLAGRFQPRVFFLFRSVVSWRGRSRRTSIQRAVDDM